MRLPDQSLPRDWLVLLAWTATTGWLALWSGIMGQARKLKPRSRRRFMGWVRPKNTAAGLMQLDGMIERSAWQCELAAERQINVADALELAEDAYEQMRAECEAVMTLPARLLPEHQLAAEPAVSIAA